MRWIVLLMITAGSLTVSATAIASSEWVAEIPNGTVFSCSTCHTNVPEVNDFGTDFLATNPGAPTWTMALAMMDSDGDTFSNGIELQDPTGSWTSGDPDPGDENLVTNPGDDASVPVEATTWGKIKDLFSSS